jgi:1-acyl-sn-glycerol-3-phosphate acyltransferase
LPGEPVLVAMKHEAMYETLTAFLFLDRPAPVYKRELEKIPIWGYVTKVYGSLIVDRDGGAKAMRRLLADGRALTAEGRPILIFPEGTRVPHGQRPEIKAGIAGLYRILGLPVLPIAVDSGKLWPRGSWVKRPGVVTFKVGDPIPPGLSREEVERRVWEGINALNG